MNILTFSTFYKIESIQSDMRGALAIMESLTSQTYAGERLPLGYMLDDKGDTLKIPRGYGYNNVSNIISKHNYQANPIHMPIEQSGKSLKIFMSATGSFWNSTEL